VIALRTIMPPTTSGSKKVTGRYQLQFPLEWVRRRLAGATAEQLRAAILEAFYRAGAALQLRWRQSFESAKSSLMSSTLTVENRTGRRFDRDAYRAEAQQIYGASCVPDCATPKLLARCFKHSVDFMFEHGLYREQAPSHPLRPSSVGSAFSPRAARKRQRSPSGNADAFQYFKSVSRSSSATFTSSLPTDSVEHTPSALFDDHLAAGLDDLPPLFEEYGEEMLGSFLADADAGMLLDARVPGDSVAGASCAQASAVEVAACTLHCHSESQEHIAFRRSSSVESQLCAGNTVCARDMQVGHVSGQQLAALQMELDATQRDLIMARAQRGAAVSESQRAAARAEQLQQAHDILRVEVIAAALLHGDGDV
jgi:hypothetical protein